MKMAWPSMVGNSTSFSNGGSDVHFVVNVKTQRLGVEAPRAFQVADTDREMGDRYSLCVALISFFLVRCAPVPGFHPYQESPERQQPDKAEHDVGR